MAGKTRLRYASLMNSSFSDGTSSMRSPPVCARPRKRTRTLMVAVAIAGVANLGLVAALLPSLGILGAAIASVLSMGALAIAVMRLGTSTLRVSLPWRALAVHATGAALMYAVIVRLDAGSPVATLLLQVGTGTLIYGAFEFVFDLRARELALAGLARAGLALR